jgi:hypothetical protein
MEKPERVPNMESIPKKTMRSRLVFTVMRWSNTSWKYRLDIKNVAKTIITQRISKRVTECWIIIESILTNR